MGEIRRWSRVDEIMEQDDDGEWCEYDDQLAALDSQREDFAREAAEIVSAETGWGHEAV